jgi:hypothetical protein
MNSQQHDIWLFRIKNYFCTSYFLATLIAVIPGLLFIIQYGLDNLKVILNTTMLSWQITIECWYEVMKRKNGGK